MPGLFDRIKDTWVAASPTLLTTLSSFVVSGTAPGGYQTFSARYALAEGNIPVAIVSQTSNDWMTCWCTYTAANTLRVDTIMFSSNADAGVTFPVGTMDIFVTPAARAIPGLREVNTFTANNTFSATTFYGASAHGNIGSDATQMFVRGNNIAFQNAAASTTYAYINSSGNVGIGTSAPSSQLHVVSAANFQPQIIADHVAGAGTGAAYFMLDRARGTPSARTAVVSGDTLGTLMARGHDGSAVQNSAWISFDVDGTVSAGNVPAGITFLTTPVGGSSAARMHVDADGNVGIGTTGPGKRLDVVGQLRASNTAASGYALFEYGSSATATNNWHVGSEGDGTFRWYNGTFGAGTELMRITSAGRVGIGTTTPGATLELRNPSGAADLRLTSVNTLYANIYASATDFSLMAVQSTPLVLGTANVQRVTIDASGNVGVGTASPSAALHLERNQASETSLFINNTNASGYSALRFGPPDRATNLDALIYSGIAATGIRSGNRPLLFESGNGTERMRMDVNGNFGIGTGTPSSYDAKLAVFNGNIALTTTQNKLYLYYFTASNHAHISTDTGGQVTISNGTGGVAERVRINTDGRVGMGRSPDHALDVQASSGSTVIRGLSANSPTTILSEVRQDTGYNPAFLTMRRINVAGSATPSSVSIGEIRWDGSTTASVYNAFAFIRCDISTNSVNGAAAAIVFGTASGAAANDVTDKIWFHTSGGVSIGNSGNPGAGTLRLGRSDAGFEGGQIEFCRANDNTVGWYIDSYGSAAGASPNELRFIDFAGGGINRLYLTARGILTIGVDAGPTDTDTSAVGFRGAPNNVQNAAYTFALTDAGKTVYHDEVTARTWTIPANSAVPFPIGTCIIIDNTGNAGAAGTITLQITTDTLRRGDGTAGVGTRTIAASRVAMIRKTKTTEWVITGTFA